MAQKEIAKPTLICIGQRRLHRLTHREHAKDGSEDNERAQDGHTDREQGRADHEMSFLAAGVQRGRQPGDVDGPYVARDAIEDRRDEAEARVILDVFLEHEAGEAGPSVDPLETLRTSTVRRRERARPTRSG